MNKKALKIPLIALAVFLTLIPHQVGASSSFQVSQTFWGSATSPLEVGPGDKSVTINVVIQNIGSQTFSGLDATLYLQSPFSNITGGNMAETLYPGSVQVGQTATLQFQLNVDDTAPIGSYTIAMSLRYGTRFSLGETLFVPVLLLGRVEFETSIYPLSISPGSRSTLMISIRNKGTGYASKVTTTLSIPTGLTIEGDNQFLFQSIAPNEIKTIALSTYAQPSLAGSSLSVGASLTYNDAYGTSRAVNKVVGLSVSPTTDIPLALTVEGGDLRPGMPNNVTLSIMNNQARPVSFVKALLTLPSSSLVVLGDNSWFFRSIAPLQNMTFSTRLMVPLAAAGSNYQLTLTLSYLDPSNVTRSESHLIGVQVLPAPGDILIASVDQGIMTAGSVNEPRITISNTGKALIHSITISFTLPTAPSASTAGMPFVLTSGNQWHYDLLLPNKNVTFTPKIFTTLGAIDTAYQVQLSISYTDENEISRLETKSLGFAIKGAINFEFLDILLTPRAAYPGANMTVTGDMLNKGTSRAMYTTVSIKPSSYFDQPLGGPSYIGEVDTNIVTPFSLSLSVKRTVTNGTYPLVLVFNYQNDYGDKFSFNRTLNVNVGSYVPPTTRPSQSTQGNIVTQMAPYLVIAAVAVLVVVLFYRRRKRHQK